MAPQPGIRSAKKVSGNCSAVEHLENLLTFIRDISDIEFFFGDPLYALNGQGLARDYMKSRTPENLSELDIKIKCVWHILDGSLRVS